MTTREGLYRWALSVLPDHVQGDGTHILFYLGEPSQSGNAA
ncbi:hypothetical protein [Actinoallomurus liliacearum]